MTDAMTALDAQMMDNLMKVNRERLTVVFDLVKPSPNWKYPINALVPQTAATREEIEEAVIFYTGCVPDVFPEGDSWAVVGAGYYAAVGA